MDDKVQALKSAVNRWRSKNVSDYWLSFSYMGPVLHHFGDHTISVVGGQPYHAWDDGWRELKKGGDFWLFTVPGTFTWARDLMLKVAPKANASPDAIAITFDEGYGYVTKLDVKFAERDGQNFNLDVRSFGEGPHPNFTQPE